MLHTKFQGHRPFGSREEDFLRFLPYMGMVAILVMWSEPFEQTFVPPPHGDSIWNLASISPVVSEEMMFKQCERQPDDRQTDDGGLPILKAHQWAFPSGELKSKETLTLHCMGKIFISLFTGIKFRIWRVTFLKSFLPLKHFGMDFRFLRNRRFTTCPLRWDRF